MSESALTYTKTALAMALILMVLLPPAAQAQGRAGSFFDGATGEPYTRPSFTAVAGLENLTAISASNASAYFLESDGTVWAVGDGAKGELGTGGTEDAPNTAVRVSFPARTVITAIGEAKDEGFAIDRTGQGWAWGANGEGSLCLGSRGTGVHLAPTRVPGMTHAVAVAGGENHSLWLLADGTVQACGTNRHGQLGIGLEITESKSPLLVPGLSGIVEISGGERTSAARDGRGRLFTWGANANGELGLGTTVDGFLPAQVSLPGPVTQVYAGGNAGENGHTLALVGGEVFGWGKDEYGDVGDGATSVTRPTPVATGLHYASVVASGRSSLGLDAEGNVWAFGADRGEALGNGPGVEGQPVPALVDSGATMISGTSTVSVDG